MSWVDVLRLLQDRTHGGRAERSVGTLVRKEQSGFAGSTDRPWSSRCPNSWTLQVEEGERHERRASPNSPWLVKPLDE